MAIKSSLRKLFLVSKHQKFNLFAQISLVVTIFIIILINALSAIPQGHIDLTEERLYSLEPFTLNLLKELESSINIYFLVNRQQMARESVIQIDEVLKLYQQKSSKVTYQTVDPERQPQLLASIKQQDLELSNGSVIIEGPLYTKVVPSYDLFSFSYDSSNMPKPASINVERLVTNAITYVQTGQNTKIYATSGHGETDFADVKTAKNLDFFTSLEQDYYIVENLPLLNRAIPEDAEMIAIISPQSDFSEYEILTLSNYLKAGGHLYVQINPVFYLKNQEFPQLSALLNEYGVIIRSNYIQEQAAPHLLASQQGNPFIFIAELRAHAINNAVDKKRGIYIAFSPLVIEKPELIRRTLSVEPVLSTSLQGQALLINDSGEATAVKKGQFDFAVAVTEKVADKNDSSKEIDEPRLFVITQDIKNLTFSVDNEIFIKNAIEWLNSRQDSLQLEAKSLYELPLKINYVMAILLAIIFVILLPTIAWLMAVVVYQKRKNL